MKHLKIDITFSDQEEEAYFIAGVGFAQPVHLGIKCCEFIKQKLQEYPCLEPLTLILKKFLAVRDLNSPFLGNFFNQLTFIGGLSSYGLILLILAYIDLDQPSMYNLDDSVTVARIFTQFLFYYGKIFDYKLQIINEYCEIINQINFSSILVILDPLNPTNNIGKSTFNFESIKREFSSAYDKLMDSMNSFTENCDQQDSVSDAHTSDLTLKLNLLSKLIYNTRE